MKLKVLALLLLLGVAGVSPRSFGQLASPYSNSVWPAQTFTASAQTGSTQQLNGLVVSSTVGSSFASGTVTVTGTSLTTVTFAVMGSSDNGATFYALPIYTVASPSTTPTTTITATANGIYQVSLAGLTHIKFVTSGTFTATAVSIVLTASPNAGISKGASGGSSLPTATAAGQAPVYNGSAYTAQAVPVQDTRPRATTSAVGVSVGTHTSCVLSISPATAGQQTVASCNTGTPSGPGTITGIHLTLGPASDGANILQNSTISFNCDGETRTAPLGMFFLTQDNPIPFSNDWIADSLGSQVHFSANRRMELNFTTGCTVTFNNVSASASTILFGEVDYRLGANVSRPGRKYWHMFAVPSTSFTHYTNLQMLPTATDLLGGELESVSLWTNSSTNGATLEGYTTVNVDGNAAVQANGTEDFFGSGYYAVNTVGGHTSSKWGTFYTSAIGAEIGVTSSSLQSPAGTYDALLYRNFQTDDRENALFTNTLSVFQPNGENGKPGAIDPGTVNMASLVTFWTHDPMVASPSYSPPTGSAIANSTTITMATATSGAVICSTIDGSSPTANGAGSCTHGTAGTTVVVSPAVTVTALATHSGSYADSFISSASYNSGSGASHFWPMTEGNGATSLVDHIGTTNLAVSGSPAWSVQSGMGATAVPAFLNTPYAEASAVDATLNFNGAQAMSVNWWTIINASGNQIVAGTEQSSGIGWQIGYTSSGQTIFTVNGASGTLVVKTTSASPQYANTAYMMTVTYDGSMSPSGVTIYQNGVSQALTTVTNTLTTGSTSTQPFTLAHTANGGVGAYGYFAYMRTYSSVLTSGAVSTLYSSGPQ